jgi:hypothetical protein
MVPVVSSNVESVGYDPATKKLRVVFRGGSAYIYFDVPEEIYTRMLLPNQSVGSLIAREVRPRFAFQADLEVRS